MRAADRSDTCGSLCVTGVCVWEEERGEGLHRR